MNKNLRQLPLDDLKDLYFQLEEDLAEAHDDQYDADIHEDWPRMERAWKRADRLAHRLGKVAKELERRGYVDCWTPHFAR